MTNTISSYNDCPVGIVVATYEPHNVIQLFSDLKTMFYTCCVIANERDDTTSQDALDFVTDMNIRISGMRATTLFDDIQYYERLLVDYQQHSGIQAYVAKYEAIYDYGGKAYYHEAGYGEFWNEVPLPMCIATLFTIYKELIADCFNETHAPQQKPRDGHVAIGYYDLSDARICFDNYEKAEAFADRFPVDPSAFMEYHDGGWSQ